MVLKLRQVLHLSNKEFFALNKRLFPSIIKIVLIVTLSMAAIATIVVLSKCVELTREGIYIDLAPLLDLVSRSISR